MKNFLRSAAELSKILPNNKTFCLIGGCFDLLHVGHLHVLQYAASLEDILVVALLSDTYIRGYKGQGRPIINERQRATVLSCLKFVDHVYISDVSPSSESTILLLRPNSVVFDADSENPSRVERKSNLIRSYSPHTKVHTLPRYTEENVSTSEIVRKIRTGG